MQNKKMSIIEATVNTTTGYFLNILTQHIVYTIFDISIKVEKYFIIGLIFFCVSISRNYLMRRIFNKIKKVK
jgi:hypothetical protein